MMDSLFNSTAIPVTEQLASFAQARHQVLAGNLANIDTPGYKTRDLSAPLFQQKLKQALAERDKPSMSNGDGPIHRQLNSLDQVRRELSHILFHDDSNVGVEQQVTEIAKNQLQHNVAMTIMSNQFRLLQSAISERA